MLLHEHFQYFTPLALERTLLEAGFDPVIKRAIFGRSLYACATFSESKIDSKIQEYELSSFYSYAEKVRLVRSEFQKRLTYLLAHETVGVYCPGRALALLSSSHKVRFFDDSVKLHGKYFPPFKARIESRDELVRNPPSVLLIMTRTFGVKLFDELQPLLPNTRILQINELLHAQ